MDNLSYDRLLFIEPENKKTDFPVDDEYTAKMEGLLNGAKKGAYSGGIFDTDSGWRGWHTCVCGKHSDNKDYLIDKYVTNSLAVHYLRWHRYEVPESEIKKLNSIDG